MVKIMHLIRHELKPDGRGGHHRAYQINFDLKSIFGEDNVQQISLLDSDVKEHSQFNLYFNAIKQRINFLKNAIKRGFNPKFVLMDLMTQSGDLYTGFDKLPIKNYVNYINEFGKPTVCLIDHPSFIPVIVFNRTHGIKTIYIPQNIDSFDQSALDLLGRKQRNNFALKWLTELEALVNSDERLMISKLETEILNGLGLSAAYYPYLPVGEVRKNLMNVRMKRCPGLINKKTFLMFGSITHQTTYKGFSWLLENIKEYGLPDGYRLIVAGRGSGKLSAEFSGIKKIEFHGLLSQQKLEELLYQVTAVLVPQMHGFGAVTRISEMSCAGIPVIASEHTSFAMEVPPGVTLVNDEWSIWKNTMSEINTNSSVNSLEKFIAWEINQTNPLKRIIKRYL